MLDAKAIIALQELVKDGVVLEFYDLGLGIQVKVSKSVADKGRFSIGAMIQRGEFDEAEAEFANYVEVMRRRVVLVFEEIEADRPKLYEET